MKKYVQKLLSTAINTCYEFQILIHLEIMLLYRQINFSRKIKIKNISLLTDKIMLTI